jgi:hypothetical protein
METPSVSTVFSEAWGGAPAIFRSRPTLYWAWLAGGLVLGALALLTPAGAFSNPNGPPITAALVPALIGYALLAAIATYFILADAVRTIVPAFQMTVQVFFIMFLLNMAYSMAIQFAAYVLIIPAFYVAPKLWLWTPNYLLTSMGTIDVAGNFTHAWRDTNNLYWPTLGFMLLQGFVAVALEVVALGIGCLAIQFFAPSAIVMVPFMLAVTLFCLAFVYLGWLKWAVAIRRHSDALAVAVAQPSAL